MRRQMIFPGENFFIPDMVRLGTIKNGDALDTDLSG
jgi:hypothetical protein